MECKEYYAILLTQGKEYSRWYYGAGKYINTFSTSSEVKGAKLFPSIEKAEKLLQSEKFQERLARVNNLQIRCGFSEYAPVIKKVQL